MTSDCNIAFVSGLLVTKEIKKSSYDQEVIFSIVEFAILFLLLLILKMHSSKQFVGFSLHLMIAIVILLFLRVFIIYGEKKLTQHTDYLFKEISHDISKIDAFTDWVIYLDTLVALDPYFIMITLLILTIFHVKIRSIEMQLIGDEA